MLDNSGNQKKTTGIEGNKNKDISVSILTIERERVLLCTSAMGRDFELIIPGKLT